MLLAWCKQTFVINEHWNIVKNVSLEFMEDLFLWEEEGCCEFYSTVVELFLVHSVKDKSGSFRYHLLKRMKLDSVQLSVER